MDDCVFQKWRGSYEGLKRARMKELVAGVRLDEARKRLHAIESGDDPSIKEAVDGLMSAHQNHECARGSVADAEKLVALLEPMLHEEVTPG